VNIGDVFLRLQAEDQGFEKDVVKRAGDTGAKAGQTMGQRMSAALNPKNVLAGFAAITAGAQVLNFFGDAVEAAREETTSVAQLTASLEANSVAYEGNSDAIEEVIEDRMALGFADDEQRESLAKLTAITKDHNQALALQRTAMDLARLRNISLATASDLLGKVYGGNVSILSRYGIQLEKGATSTEALAAIQEMASGQAEAWADTEAGAAATAGLAMGELTEDIGGLLLPMLTELAKFIRDVVVPAFGFIVDVIGFISGPIGTVAGVIGGFIDLVGDAVTAVTGGHQEMTEAQEVAVIESGRQWEAYQAQIRGAIPGVEDAAEELAEIPLTSVRERFAPMRGAAYQQMVEYAKGLLDAQNEPKVQMEALRQMQDEELTKMEEVAFLKGQLMSRRLASALLDERPGVRAQAEATRLAIVNRLAELGVEAWEWGHNISEELAAGMIVGKGVVVDAASELAQGVRSQIAINSEPEGNDSPLRGITHWGGNIVKTLADDLLANLGLGRAAGAALAGALAPSMSGMAPAFAGASGSGGQGGPTFILQVDGANKVVGTRSDVLDGWDQIGRFEQ
jgi:hypothetical protein